MGNLPKIVRECTTPARIGKVGIRVTMTFWFFSFELGNVGLGLTLGC